MLSINFINEKEYLSDEKSLKLFEESNPYSYGRIEIDGVNAKFSWSSKNIRPQIKFLEGEQLVFIGVDFNVVGFNCKTNCIDFAISTISFFKWFDEIQNGIALIAETEILLINTINKCTLRNHFFFTDIIMGSKVEKDKMFLEFLASEPEIISIL